MHKRAGDITIDSGDNKESLITIRVNYNDYVAKEIELHGYDDLCDLEYLVKRLKEKMEDKEQ